MYKMYKVLTGTGNHFDLQTGKNSPVNNEDKSILSTIKKQ